MGRGGPRAGSTPSCSLCRPRRGWWPRRRGSRRSRATGTRKRAYRAIHTTLSKPNLSGSCSPCRVPWPTGCWRPAAVCAYSHRADSAPRQGAVAATAASKRPRPCSQLGHPMAPLAPAGGWAKRVVARAGRACVPADGPLPGARIHAISSPQKTSKCWAGAQRQCLLSGEST